MREVLLSIEQVIDRYAKNMANLQCEEELLWYVAEEMVGALGFDDCIIYTLDESENNLIQRAAFGPKVESAWKKRVKNPLRIAKGHGITGLVALTAKPIIVADVSKEARYISDLEDQQASEIAVPIFVDDRCYGVIDCEDPTLNAFSEKHLNFLNCIASLVSSKLECIAAQRKMQGFRYVSAKELQEHKRAFEDQIDAQKENYESQAMHIISQLSAGLAHDINNQLAIMRNGLDIAALENPKLEKTLKASLHAIESCAELTHQMLAFSSQQTLFPGCVDVSQIVSGVKAFLSRSLGNWIDIRTKIEPELWTINIDQSQFERALLNLAVNARDAMPKGGRLSFSCYNIELEEGALAKNSHLDAGDYVVVAVSDTGTGMTDFVRAHAFEPFFTTKKSQNGTGLGLSQVFGFVRQSGGEVTIHSNNDEKGTVVKMYFPKDVSEAPLLHAKAQEQHLYRGDNQQVLVIEDDITLSASLKKTLKILGYDPIIANTAREARKMVVKNDKIELIISDIMLDAGTRGHELYEEMRAMGVMVPCIYMSGFVEGAGDLDGVDLKAGNFLQKPFSVHDLSKTIFETFSIAKVIPFTGTYH